MPHNKKTVQKESRDLAAEWEISRKYSGLYGSIPSSFGSLIRGLHIDQAKNQELSFASKWQMNRLLRSDSMKAAYYFALRTYRKDMFAGTKPLTIANLAVALKPQDLAALLAVLYLFRRARHMLDPNEWKFTAPLIHTRADLGGQIGVMMENVGLGFGLLAGVMRYLGMLAFIVHDKSGFGEYRRKLKISNKAYDLRAERERWGCSHVQICSNLMVSIGLCSDTVESVRRGFEMKELNVNSARTKSYAVRVTELWIDSLILNLSPPKAPSSGFYDLSQEDLSNLLEEAKK
ncbi:MAG: hypothetical protein GX589_01510, partial [Deltaproteobacteria bacterium]|nr:hypothetical protein [Deltaproteobacteria bacterium]